MKKVLIVIGTRPEAIKMAPVFKCLNNYHNQFRTKICITAQHREMLDNVLDFFNIKPDYDLNLMSPNQTLEEIFAKIITECSKVYFDFKPDYIFVHGDTITCLGASYAAFLQKIKICHVEAGLRTYNKYSPFPEEINRQLVSKLTDYHFAPTQLSQKNLISEKIKKTNIIITGNTVIDALKESIKIVNQENFNNKEIKYLTEIIVTKKIILVTSHRRENFGEGILQICQALKGIAIDNPDVQIIFPVHLNPNIKEVVNTQLNDIVNISLITPLSYPSFVWLMDKCYFIITDSGGIQEEAPSLGKPVLVMRDNTERPEAVTAGTVILVGTNSEKITSVSNELLRNHTYYNSFSKKNNPYGDGKASQRIVDFLIKKNNNEN
ncbi:non-hydrolyzing UDP-N-acetylglucosamine 2-epimerase [Runella aurantiaca]|uniref:UDP-N-acetylglucosamine 2-epimerase (non-hydrolyzing) n=1 Tax=Runella aurantiaca TaxID=2282308 RepID=A0A369IBM8_9BACT|nr:UDP-N-acetylglucosamine 2-epimerase (non-hydrolyzing) [Runella aurantiaca]RDB06280.1 UDP-N-acetylglucosamine 2-epimerase (non-hydrolyzing) [Runella aurantiaca]